jgi:predicted HicB family RNase H-like nuclease
MKNMIYKGYAARLACSEEDGCFVGHLARIRDVVGFHATSVRELRSAFREAVDDYVQTCDRAGIAPKRPYSGKLMLRLPPEVHAAVATAAQVDGRSINQWAAEVFERAAAR